MQFGDQFVPTAGHAGLLAEWLTGYIGQQQLSPAGDVLAGPRLLWGAISTAGYLVIPLVLFTRIRRLRAARRPRSVRRSASLH